MDQTGTPFNLGGIRYMAASPQMLWANAAGKLAMGVHGIEQFNFFCTDQPKIPGLRGQYSALKGTHDLASLRGKPKHYCLSTPSGNNSMAWELPEQLPAVIGSKQRREFRLSMCAEQKGKLAVQVLIAKGTVAEPRLGVSVNGASRSTKSRPHRKCCFRWARTHITCRTRLRITSLATSR